MLPVARNDRDFTAWGSLLGKLAADRKASPDRYLL
jgi:hypothetical protein